MKTVQHYVHLMTILFFLTTAYTAETVTEVNVTIDPTIEYQTIEGFGAALAYYENWLTAHPNKAAIYDAIFGELSLDILRVRNAHEYDTSMIERVVEFCSEAETALGHPIKLLSTSWGPPARLKSNGDRKSGGTLAYRTSNGSVEFDYSGFAEWWQSSLKEYSDNGIYPNYISIQNEPDFTATWESCRFDPSETVNETDTIAGYNRALETIINSFEPGDLKPKIFGPELVGIGYNKLQNYVDSLDLTLLDGVAHHLYHGVDKTDPWLPNDLATAGAVAPELPHYQTEYGEGDWFATAGLIYQSLVDESVAAYFFWDLVWDKRGLVELDNPWTKDSWTFAEGYHKSQQFYAFKQFSAFIHPGWKRVAVSSSRDSLNATAFANASGDSLSLILINRSDSVIADLSIDNYSAEEISVFRTSETESCVPVDAELPLLTIPPKSITTIQLRGVQATTSIASATPMRNKTLLFTVDQSNIEAVSIYNAQGRRVMQLDEFSEGMLFNTSHLSHGFYVGLIELKNGSMQTFQFLKK